MLKFQNNHTTEIATFEDFILTVYVMIDDLYQEYAPKAVSRRRHIQNAKLSDPEIITIAICGELAGIDSENAWFSFVKRNYRHLFPKLCSRSRFNRTRRNLLQVTELLWEKLLCTFSMPCSRYFIIDSFPLAVCKFGRAHYCHSFRGYGADYGKCPSKKETYFGYKVHAMVTLEGFLTAFEITPASVERALKNILFFGFEFHINIKIHQILSFSGGFFIFRIKLYSFQVVYFLFLPYQLNNPFEIYCKYGHSLLHFHSNKT